MWGAVCKSRARAASPSRPRGDYLCAPRRCSCCSWPFPPPFWRRDGSFRDRRSLRRSVHRPVHAPRGAVLERTSSNVRATLADHVLRYEVEETFRNRGGDRGRGGLHVSAAGRRGVPGAAALDQRPARVRRDHGCGTRALDVRGDRAAPARSRARRVDGLRAPARAHLPDQSRRGEARAAALPGDRAARGRRDSRRLPARQRRDASRRAGTHDARESIFTLRYPKSGRCDAYSPTQELQSRAERRRVHGRRRRRGRGGDDPHPCAAYRPRRDLGAGERAGLRGWLRAHHALPAIGTERDGAARHHLRARRLRLDERAQDGAGARRRAPAARHPHVETIASA